MASKEPKSVKSTKSTGSRRRRPRSRRSLREKQPGLPGGGPAGEMEEIEEVSDVWKEALKWLALSEAFLGIILTIVTVGSVGLVGYAVYNYQLDEMIRTAKFWGPYNVISCFQAIITGGIGLAAFIPTPPNKPLAYVYSAVLIVSSASYVVWFGFSLMYDVGCSIKLATFTGTHVAGCFDQKFAGVGAPSPAHTKYTTDDNYYVNLGIVIFEWIKMFLWLTIIGINAISFVVLAYNWDLLDYIYDEDEEIPATEDPRTVVVVSPDTSPATSTVTSPQTSQTG